MKISDFLSSSCAVADMRASDKRQLLFELAGQAESMLQLPAADVAAALLEREDLGSTGMGNGVAIPHARIQAAAKPFGLLARLRQPIDFDAIDGQPVDLVFLLILPTTAEGEQLGALASVARKLREPGTLAQLRGAKNAADLYAAMIA